MRRLLFLFTSLLCFFVNGFAQESIKGKITTVDNGLKAPLEGVNIFRLETTMGTISKNDGSFEIEK